MQLDVGITAAVLNKMIPRTYREYKATLQRLKIRREKEQNDSHNQRVYEEARIRALKSSAQISSLIDYEENARFLKSVDKIFNISRHEVLNDDTQVELGLLDTRMYEKRLRAMRKCFPVTSDRGVQFPEPKSTGEAGNEENVLYY